MPRPYSVDLRERVMAAVADGRPFAEVAQAFSVSVDAIYDWRHRQQTSGSVAPVTGQGGHPRAVSAAQHQLLRERIAAMPDATSRDLRDWLATEHQVMVSTSAVWRTLTRMDLTRKKSLIATEQDADRRAAWQAEQPALSPDDLVFLDETSTQTNLTRTHGRAPKGERLVAAIPRNHGPNLTCLAAVTVTGMGPSLVFEGALDGAIFTQWITEHLVPSLRPGQIVILDTLSVHKVVAARDAIVAAGCALRFLPAYSPDFNPIEQIFSRLKAHLRAVGTRAIPALTDAIDVALNAVTATQARATFRHAGYQDTGQP